VSGAPGEGVDGAPGNVDDGDKLAGAVVGEGHTVIAGVAHGGELTGAVEDEGVGAAPAHLVATGNGNQLIAVGGVGGEVAARVGLEGVSAAIGGNEDGLGAQVLLGILEEGRNKPHRPGRMPAVAEGPVVGGEDVEELHPGALHHPVAAVAALPGHGDAARRHRQVGGAAGVGAGGVEDLAGGRTTTQTEQQRNKDADGQAKADQVVVDALDQDDALGLSVKR